MSTEKEESAKAFAENRDDITKKDAPPNQPERGPQPVPRPAGPSPGRGPMQAAPRQPAPSQPDRFTEDQSRFSNTLKEKRGQSPSKQQGPSPDKSADAKNESTLSMSTRFTMNLGHSKAATPNPAPPTAPSKGKDKGKE